jgi:beta-galactosidase
VHVFTSGDEAELFLNGKSLGRKKKAEYQDRLRWDDVTYKPGELKVVAYKDGKEWATDVVRTTDAPAGLAVAADRWEIRADGLDLSFVTVRVIDEDGLTCPRADNAIRFSIEGPGEIVVTDNGDPTSLVAFPSAERQAFNGLCLAIVCGKPGQPGRIRLAVSSDGLEGGSVVIVAEGAGTDPSRL